MDNPNGEGNGSDPSSNSGSSSSPNNPLANMSRREFAQKVQGDMRERQQHMRESIARYGPHVREQVFRLFSEYQPPLYAKLRGNTREGMLSGASAFITAQTAGPDRELRDEEVRALGEHAFAAAHSQILWNWGVTAFAGYMTYRGRTEMHFPIWKRPFPQSAQPHLVRPPYRYFVQTFRFAAYYMVAKVFAAPIYSAYILYREAQSMDADDRLQDLKRSREESRDRQREAVQSKTSTHSVPPSSPPSPSYQTPYRYPQTTKSDEQPPASGADWNSYIDDDDDASPVASSARSRPNASAPTGGSAWDRLRQQSQPRRSDDYRSMTQDQQQSQRQSWGSSQNQPAWGEDAGRSPEYRGQQESYSFSGQDDSRDKAAKDQAQREFDQLLERERSGVDQGRSSWGRR